MRPTISMTDHTTDKLHSLCLEQKQQSIRKNISSKGPSSLTWAYRLYWCTFLLFFASTTVGKVWDRYWHFTQRFDTFWSPPHLFVFVMTAITGILVTIITLTPSLRVWFGPSIHIPLTKINIPGSLIILIYGLVMLNITIMLDNYWHSTFGLNETQWSFPHNMLVWTWFTIIIGFVTARFAFRRYRPITWMTNLIIALFVLAFLCPAILGPFYLNYSPELLQALANSAIIRTEPDAQHMYRIYLNFSLTRQTHIIFIPMVSLFAGIAMAFLYRLDKQARVFLLAPLLWSIIFIARDIYTIYHLHIGGVQKPIDLLGILHIKTYLWLPIPLVVAFYLYYLLRNSHFLDLHRYAICGFVFSLCTFIIWHTTLWMVLLAIPGAFLTALGGWVGHWIYKHLERPSIEGLTKLLLITCAQIPAALGVVDLFLRIATP